MADSTENTETTEMVTESTETVDATQDTTEGTDLEAELKAARAALKRANREAAERRKQLEAFEKAEEERKHAEMSELEKAQERIAKLEARAKAAEAERELLARRQEFYAEIGKQNLQFANEQARQDAAMLVNLSEMDGEMDDIVKGLKETRPYLFVTATAPDIDGKKRGKGNTTETREEALKALSVRYGFDYVPPD